MVDAYTFQKGNQSHSFSSRAELFDWMIENGEYFLDETTGAKMLKHVKLRLTKEPNNAKLIQAKETLEYNGVE